MKDDFLEPPHRNNSLQARLLGPGASPQHAVDVDAAEEQQKTGILAKGRLYEKKLRQIDDLHARCAQTHKILLYSIRRIMWTWKVKAMNEGVWDIFGHALRVELPYDRDRDLFPGTWVRSFLPAGNVPDNFIKGLDDGAIRDDGTAPDRGITGWLYEYQIEVLFQALRPETLDNDTYYLKREYTRLLGPDMLEELSSLDFANFGDLGDRWGLHRMEAMPEATKRIMMFVNISGNHWFTVCGQRIDEHRGSITVYDSNTSGAFYYTYLGRFFRVLSHLDNSPFSGIHDWFCTNYVDMPQQTNCDDCGIFTLDTLLNLARGMTISSSTSLTGYELRETYLEHFATLVTMSSDIDISEELAEEYKVGNGAEAAKESDVNRLLRSKLDKLSIAHWQHMVVGANPALQNDLERQKSHIMRICSRRLKGIASLDELSPVTLPLDTMQTIPLASFALNDHDVLPFRPDPNHIPYAVTAWNRESRGSFSTPKHLAKAGKLLQKWLKSYYPHVDLANIQTRSYHFAHSSCLNFAGIRRDGSLGTMPSKQSNTENVED